MVIVVDDKCNLNLCDGRGGHGACNSSRNPTVHALGLSAIPNPTNRDLQSAHHKQSAHHQRRQSQRTPSLPSPPSTTARNHTHPLDMPPKRTKRTTRSSKPAGETPSTPVSRPDTEIPKSPSRRSGRNREEPQASVATPEPSVQAEEDANLLQKREYLRYNLI